MQHIMIVIVTALVLSQTAIAAESTPNPETTTSDKPAKPTLVFYEIPPCPICKKINGWLDTLNKEYPNKAEIIRIPSSEALHVEMVSRGIDHHGVVILATDGKVSWSHNAHDLTEEALRQGFTQFAVEVNPATPAAAAQPGSKSTDKTLAVNVTGMDCGGCAQKINTAVAKLNGVTKCNVTFESNGGDIQYDPAKITEQKILEAVKKAGYGASVKKSESK